jgi:2-amino-4-hydroxy-6-hydroxymethyldihydropteridine diphosphokinase
VAVSAFLGLGSNLGDRLGTLQRAVELLQATDGVEVVRSSRVYETAPVGPSQPEFLNAVVEVSSDLEPRDLLAACAAVERELGRVRAERWGPRTIDVDLLTYDEMTVDDPDLTIPHPRMHERGFVLVPLRELDADPMLPGGRSLASLRLAPGAILGVRAFAPPLVGPVTLGGERSRVRARCLRPPDPPGAG